MRKRQIFLMDAPNLKAGRDRISGVLRYAAKKPDWSVHLVDLLSPSLSQLRQLISTGETIDGIIGYPAALVERGIYTRRQLNRIPIVSNDLPAGIRSPFTPLAVVNTDNAAIAHEATRLLLERGVRHLAYVGNDALTHESRIDSRHSLQREAAMQKYAQSAGVSFSAFRSSPHHDWAKDLKCLADWISHLPYPCGVLAFTDKRAQKVANACHLAHMMIPEHVRLVGIDNEVEICENMRPTLTSVLPDFDSGGYLAAQTLDDILVHGRPKTMLEIGYGIRHIVERASTQDLKGAARIVSLASEYIRVHASEPIDVEDIAHHLNLSRRTLEHRFAEILGTSPAAALRTRRLENVCRQLLDTRLSAEEIASHSGFASSAHLKQLFKKTYGQTPGDYRRQHQEAPVHINCRA